MELYNLADDIGEYKDLAHANPAKRDELLDELLAWFKAAGAKLPTQPNPACDPNASYIVPTKQGEQAGEGEQEQMEKPAQTGKRQTPQQGLSRSARTEAAFKAFDANSDGRVNLAEFTAGAWGRDAGGKAGDVFKTIDADTSGGISRHELKAYIPRSAGKGSP